ncbi:MAG: zinc-ribbon domain-containing protein [Eubacteriales bacterium]
MSELCKACGAKIREGENICEYCGTAVSRKTNRFCRKCGTSYSEGALFCRKCGTLTSEHPAQDKAVNKPPMPYTNRKQPQTIRTSEPASVPVPAIRRKSPLAAIIASILIFAIIIGAVTVGVNKCGEEAINGNSGLTNITYTEKELSVKGTQASVSPESPVAAAGDVTLDFGAFNLYGESTLEVKALPQKNDSRTGVTVTAYDFTLTDNVSRETVSEFPTLVDITIPCTATADEYAFVQYYDRDAKEWQIIDSRRNYENNTMTFQTTHFSIYGESKMILGTQYSMGPAGEPTLPSQSFAYIGGYDGPLTEVYFVSADLDKLMDELDFDTMIKILNSCKVYPHDMATALMGLGNDAANVLDLSATNKLINTMLRTDSGLAKWSTSIRLVGSALVFAKVAYQLYIGGEVETVAYINAVNITEALLTVAGVVLGSEALLMMATAVFIGNTIYSLATLEFTTIQEQGYINFNDGLGAVFYAESLNVMPKETVSLSQAYYTPSGPITLDRGGKGFARALDAIYIHYIDKPAELQKAVENLINDYVNCFWDSPTLTDADRVRYAYYKEGYDANNPPRWIQPSPEAIQSYKDKFREKLMSDIKPLMKEFAERVLHDLKLKLRDTIEKDYVPFLNTVITIQAEVKNAPPAENTFDKTIYARDYYMRFSPENLLYWVSAEDYMTDYNPRARENSNEIYKSTVYNFIQIGDPAEIEFINQVTSSSDEDDFYTEIDWTAFPTGKILITEKQATVGSMTFYDGPGLEGYEKVISKILQSKGNITPVYLEKDIFSLELSGSVSDSSTPSSGKDYYTTESENYVLSSLLIEGGLAPGDRCTISATANTTSRSERMEAYSGDYYDVEDYWISEGSGTYMIAGTGTVSYRSTYDNNLGNIKLMILTFDTIGVSGMRNFKTISKTISNTNPANNRSEVISDTATPIDENTSFTLSFIID